MACASMSLRGLDICASFKPCLQVKARRRIHNHHPRTGRPAATVGLAHWAYCSRQCGLIHPEQSFDDNLHTLRGQAVHKQVDQPGMEIRKGLRVERALPVWHDALAMRSRRGDLLCHVEAAPPRGHRPRLAPAVPAPWPRNPAGPSAGFARPTCSSLKRHRLVLAASPAINSDGADLKHVIQRRPPTLTQLNSTPPQRARPARRQPSLAKPPWPFPRQARC